MNRDRTLDKLSESCKMVNQVNRAFRRTYADALMIVTLGRLPDDTESGERSPLDDLESLVALELPDFAIECRNLKTSRDRLGKLFTDAVLAISIDKSVNAPTGDNLSIELKVAESACDAFLSKAYAIVRTLQ